MISLIMPGIQPMGRFQPVSVLNQDSDQVLRYYHEDGLIMRHDKEVFAGDSIAAAKDGTYIADILRILYYTYYSKLLPGGQVHRQRLRCRGRGDEALDHQYRRGPGRPAQEVVPRISASMGEIRELLSE